ncbi:MAG TPA: N-acetylgalactosamine 6-sulfate sulfatase [Verrucomicrobiales bacterium]|nr:N-acetylgalactosamine 6-sulfate sulfatase [Verrucomicrobiales bacterium]
MLRRKLAGLFIGVLMMASCPIHARQPNIVIILADDQGWGDLSLHGNTNLATPNIDSLARDGATFEHFFVSPVCSPTRAELLTGRWHPRGNVYSTSAGGERLDLDETTMGDVFKRAGYATGAFGKWHNGMQWPYHPNARGFDEFYGFCSGHWANYFDPMLEQNGRIVKGRGFIIDDLTDHAMAFMEANRNRPFLCYVPYNTPHSPMQVPDEFWERFKEKEITQRHREPEKEEVEFTRAALAMVENIDWNVGRLLAKLEELRLVDDTIVIYLTDNGPNSWRWNGGMKGRKGTTDEGGVRSPLLVRWPGKIPPRKRISQIASAIDLLPTLAHVSDVRLRTAHPVDGKSLAKLLVSDDTRWPDRHVYSHWNGKISVRSQRYRLDDAGQLFDMQTDPGQRTNVTAQFPAIAGTLKLAAMRWRDEVMADFGPAHDQRPFIVGHPDAEFTQLPARDGKASGGIKRSNRFPNASFFTQWKSTDDAITWDIEVPKAGEFDVELYYTCPAADVGSTVELSFRDSRLVGRVSDAHEPALIGAAQDRIERQESYDQDFRPMNLGRIRLEKGAGTLTLKALEIPGSQVMDFRLLMLRRVK